MTTLPAYANLLTEIRDRTVRITLNRPDKLNAINQEMVSELHDLMGHLEDAFTDHVLVFCGAGDRAFVAGADIAQLRERREPEALEGINARLFDRIARFPFPVIAAIRGFCFGGGMELALACDIRLASDDALFAQPEVGLGIIPGAGATYRLPRIVSRGLAREMIFSGLRIDASRALAEGLVNHVVPATELPELVDTIARRITKQGAQAVAAAKRLMAAEDTDAMTDAAIREQAVLFESDDKMKRMGDFLTKQGAK